MGHLGRVVPVALVHSEHGSREYGMGSCSYPVSFLNQVLDCLTVLLHHPPLVRGCPESEQPCCWVGEWFIDIISVIVLSAAISCSRARFPSLDTPCQLSLCLQKQWWVAVFGLKHLHPSPSPNILHHQLTPSSTLSPGGMMPRLFLNPLADLHAYQSRPPSARPAAPEVLQTSTDSVSLSPHPSLARGQLAAPSYPHMRHWMSIQTAFYIQGRTKKRHRER